MKYQIRIAFEELIRERNSGGNILLETISLLLVGIILFIGAINDYNQIVVQSALKGNLKNTGIVTITDNNQYKLYDTEEGYHEFANTSLHKYSLFMYELNNSSCIENPLSCHWQELDITACTDDKGNDVLTKSFERSKSRDDDYSVFSETEIGSHIHTLYVGKNYQKLLNLHVVTNYSASEQEKMLSECNGIVYMGNALEHLKEGTIIETVYGEKYIVGGTIQKSAKVPKLDDISSQTTAYEEMDYKIMIVEGIPSVSNISENIYFHIKEGYSIKDVRTEIDRIGQEIHYGTSVKNYQGIFDNITSKNKTFIRFIKQILWVILIAVVILHVSMQSVHIIENFGNYGILYANGFSLTDHILIFLIQNFLKGVAAVFLTLGAGYLALDLFFSDSLSIYSFHVLYTVILKYVLWKVFLCAIAIMVLTTLVSSVLFCKKTPSVLLKENK